MNTTDRAPARHFRPQSERQRRAVLARIDAAERETMDSFFAPLAGDPYLLRTDPAQALAQAEPKPSPAPLRLIRPLPYRPPTMLQQQHEEYERIAAQMQVIEKQLIDPAPTACGFGTCALTPECTRSCRYREADKALRGHYSERQGQAAQSPDLHPPADHNARRITAILVTAWCIGWLCMAVYWVTT